MTFRTVLLTVALLFGTTAGFCSYWDLSTFSEIDPGDDITITSSRITFTNWESRGTTTSFVYLWDGTPSPFPAPVSGTITHYLDLQYPSVGGVNPGYPCFYVLQNELKDFFDTDAESVSIDSMFAIVNNVGANNFISVYQHLITGDALDTSTVALTEGTVYYMALVRTVAGAFTCNIYSDAAHTSLVDNASISLGLNNAHKYLVLLTGATAGGESLASGYIENLDLGYPPAAGAAGNATITYGAGGNVTMTYGAGGNVTFTKG